MCANHVCLVSVGHATTAPAEKRGRDLFLRARRGVLFAALAGVNSVVQSPSSDQLPTTGIISHV